MWKELFEIGAVAAVMVVLVVASTVFTFALTSVA